MVPPLTGRPGQVTQCLLSHQSRPVYGEICILFNVFSKEDFSIKEGMSSSPAIVWVAKERTRGMSKLTETDSEKRGSTSKHGHLQLWKLTGQGGEDGGSHAWLAPTSLCTCFLEEGSPWGCAILRCFLSSATCFCSSKTSRCTWSTSLGISRRTATSSGVLCRS